MTDQTVSETLNKAADHIERYGHHKGGAVGEGPLFKSPACAVGAISIASEDAAITACDAFMAHLGHGIISWNDAPERTAAEVVEALRAAAVIAASRDDAQETDVRGVAPVEVSV